MHKYKCFLHLWDAEDWCIENAKDGYECIVYLNNSQLTKFV